MVDMIIAYLKSNKDEIVDGINKKVNIPLVSEAKEEEIFDSWDNTFNTKGIFEDGIIVFSKEIAILRDLLCRRSFK